MNRPAIRRALDRVIHELHVAERGLAKTHPDLALQLRAIRASVVAVRDALI